ncbi:hypothetical protein SFRURICE_020090 [Spodoptera frugiperda]|nr:hypothetical protein SFRURICE_020090 [Spodoptera frugiperda]
MARLFGLFVLPVNVKDARSNGCDCAVYATCMRETEPCYTVDGRTNTKPSKSYAIERNSISRSLYEKYLLKACDVKGTKDERIIIQCLLLTKNYPVALRAGALVTC